MKKLSALVYVILLAACTVFPATRSAGTPDLRATGTAQVYAIWTGMVQTFTAQPPRGMSTPTVTRVPVKRSTATPTSTRTAIPSLQAGQPIKLAGLQMVDANNGWGVESGGHIVHTSDGGFTWQDVTPPQKIYFTPPENVYLGCKFIAPGIACNFFALNADTAWVVYSEIRNDERRLGTVWRTTNGGNSWLQLRLPLDQLNFVEFFDLQGIFFLDQRHGWFFLGDGEQGHTKYTAVFTTNNGGYSWKRSSFPNSKDLDSTDIFTGIAFVDQQVGYTGSDFGMDPGIFDHPTANDYISGKSVPTIWKTTNGGETWDIMQLPKLSPIPDEFQALATSDKNDNMVCAVSELKLIPITGVGVLVYCHHIYDETFFLYYYLSSDGGQTWHSWLATGDESFVNASTGWRLVTHGSDQSSELQKTTDGGLTWLTLETAPWQAAQFDFVNQQEGWAIATSGDATTLVHTTNGGQTWEEIKPMIRNH